MLVIVSEQVPCELDCLHVSHLWPGMLFVIGLDHLATES
jgi:hypothetical protein